MNEEQLELYLTANKALRANPPHPKKTTKALNTALDTNNKFTTLILTTNHTYQLINKYPNTTHLFNKFNITPINPHSDHKTLINLHTYYQKQIKTLYSTKITIKYSSKSISLSISEQTPTYNKKLKLPTKTYDIKTTLKKTTKHSTINIKNNQQLIHHIELKEEEKEEKPDPDITLTPPNTQKQNNKTTLTRPTLIAKTSTITLTNNTSTF